LASEKAGVAGGKIFDTANDITESADNFLERLVQVSGAKGGYEYIKRANCEFC
jgi:hypothetical protein